MIFTWIANIYSTTVVHGSERTAGRVGSGRKEPRVGSGRKEPRVGSGPREVARGQLCIIYINIIFTIK